ncbi:MAG: L-threonylcarbamoyladenylate synthase [Anaplasma sp.]
MQQVVNALKNGQMVCFPTDTLYALACSALDTEAIERLYALKRRPRSKPIPVLVDDLTKIRKLSFMTEEDWRIVAQLSPGPVTFVVPLRNDESLPKEFFRNTLGVRVPNHEMARTILREFGAPVAATSANVSGMPGVGRAAEIPQEIRDHVTALIEDDSAVGGVCSTVLDVVTREVLRIGMISEQKIADVLQSCYRIQWNQL